MAEILVVDDEARVRRALGDLLERAGHRCGFASDAGAARAELARSTYDLMLCDINMPGESGLELARSALAASSGLAVVMVTGVDDAAVAEEALDLGAYGYLIKPAGRNETLITVSNALRRRALELEHQTYERRLEQTVAARTEELRSSREETIHRLAKAAEFRDNETAQHNDRMGRYCALIGGRLGMDEAECEQLRLASIMHDVGKVGVSDLVLLKPGALTDEEFGQIKRHPDIGYRILSGSRSPLLELAATIALTHHEKFDGTGYPQGLRGEAIPRAGRIAAVADVFDALTSDRVYRPAWSVQDTTALLRAERGAHFDPQPVDALLDGLDEALYIRATYVDR